MPNSIRGIGKEDSSRGITRNKGPELGKSLGRKGKEISAARREDGDGVDDLEGARSVGEEDRPGSGGIEVPKFLLCFPCEVRVQEAG